MLLCRNEVIFKIYYVIYLINIDIIFDTYVTLCQNDVIDFFSKHTIDRVYHIVLQKPSHFAWGIRTPDVKFRDRIKALALWAGQ